MIWIAVFFILMYFLFVSAIKIYKKDKMLDMELSFMKAALDYCQLKYHMIQMLEIIYEKASETDDQYLKDYQRIKETIEKKFNQTINDYIKELQESLGYNTSYNTFDELFNHAEIISKMIKKKNESRKGNKKIIK